MGWLMLLGSAGLYSPILTRVIRARDASGLSLTTWVLAILGFGSSLIYPVRNRFPLSTYSEHICLSLQSLALFSCIAIFGGHLSVPLTALVVSGIVAAWAATLALLPLALTKYVQGVGTSALIWSLIPQLAKNFSTRTGGGWSIISAALSAAGAATRIFTTIQLTGDPVVLSGHVAGFACNVVLLSQIVFFGNPPVA